jgi:uncharacterized spore protein YtfJ
MNDSQSMATLMDRIYAAASPELVFGAPVEANGYTVITAREVMAGGGFGMGSGTGPNLNGAEDPVAGGSGGGGGGGAVSRPVAVIVIGPNGVTVKPVFDGTKLGLAALAAWGAVALGAFKMARKARL